MSELELHCNGCGASLSASSAARFITCTACGLSLEVHRRENSAWTEEAENLREEVAALRVEQEVARLDREWDRKRETFCFVRARGLSEAVLLPSRLRGLSTLWGGTFLAMCIGGVGLWGGDLLVGLSAWLWVTVCMVPAVIILQGGWEVHRARLYEAARRDYEQLRNEARAAAGLAAR